MVSWNLNTMLRRWLDTPIIIWEYDWMPRVYIYFWVVPLPKNSHHQDYYIFSRGSQPKPSFATGILGGGTTQIIQYVILIFHTCLKCGVDKTVLFKNYKNAFRMLGKCGWNFTFENDITWQGVEKQLRAKGYKLDSGGISNSPGVLFWTT